MASENIFEHFASMDVSEHVQKKMNLSYLSWSWAWAMIKKYDFESTKVFTKFDEMDWNKRELTGRKLDYCKTDTGTYVECTVTIKGHSETESLYVMDHKNKSILQPNQAQINKAKQRCFVKTCALFGLGLNLYAGEDLPMDSDQSNSNNDKPKNDSNYSNNRKPYKPGNNQKSSNSSNHGSEQQKRFKQFIIDYQKTTGSDNWKDIVGQTMAELGIKEDSNGLNDTKLRVLNDKLINDLNVLRSKYLETSK